MKRALNSLMKVGRAMRQWNRRKSSLRRLIVESLERREVFAAFVPGNLAVLQAAASANNTTAAILEINPALTLQTSPVQTISVSGAAPDPIRISGSATSTGYLSRSNDGSLLTFNGHNSPTTAANANTLNPRAPVAFSADGTFTIPTTYTGTSGNQTRASTTLDNNTWFIADQGGLFANGATAASPTGNLRNIRSFGGTVYTAQASSTATTIQVATVSAATGGSITGLAGLTNNASIQDFYLIQSGENGELFDVLYTISATSNTAGTVAKFSRLAGLDTVLGTTDDDWISNGTSTTNFGGFGLAAADNGTSSGATLYVTAGQGALAANAIRKLSDTSGYNSNLAISTIDVIFTTAAGTILKGVDFVPVASNSTNNPPTISDIANQTTDEDTPIGPVSFTVGDAESDPATLIVTATSGNSTLIPNGSIVLGGSGANRTLSITPAANLSGTSVITVSVSDGTAVTTDTFTLTVNPINDAPTIEDVSDQSTATNSPKVVAFSIGDIDSDLNAVTVVGSSSNQSVVPNGNIVFGGTGANRTVTITPANNQSGAVTITLTVSDGSLNGVDTFVLTVAANEPPTISAISNQSILEDTNTGNLSFSVGDAEQPVESLVVSATSSNTALVPNANITISGSGANRTILVTPVANGFGSTTITVTVSDGISLTDETFDVLVTPVNDVPTISVIPNQTIVKNSSTAPLAFTIDDIDGDSLTITGGSSNIALVPNANVVISGTGNSRTVVVTPNVDQTGSATITLTVGDGSSSSDSAFILNVNEIPQVLINEILFNPSGTDAPNEYVELRGEPNAVVPNGVYLIGIEGDTGTGAGDVQTIFDLSGKSFDANGFMVFVQANNTYGLSAGPGVYSGTTTGFAGLSGFSADSNGTDIENSSVSFLIVSSSVAPVLTLDIDANGDGIGDGDAFSNWLVLDGVAIVDAATDTSYAPIVFALNGMVATSPSASIVNTAANTANYVARIGNSSGSNAQDWVGGGITDLVAPPAVWAFNRSQTFPATLAGARLNHLGSTNNFVPAGVTIDQSSGSTDITEGGATDSYSIVLNTQPVGIVTVILTPDTQIDLGAGSGVAINLSFSPSTWNIPQTVNVSAVDDSVAEGAHTGLVTHTIANSASTPSTLDYSGLSIPSVSANIVDNDDVSTPTVTVTSGDRDYDGTVYIASATLSGFSGTQPELSFVYYSDAGGTNTIGAPTNAGSYFVQAVSAANPSNNAAQSLITPFQIFRKALTATVTANNKTYDGTTIASLSYSNITGLVGTETVVVTGSGEFTDRNAFTGRPINANPPVLANGTNGGLASNYSLATPTGLSANILRRTLTATSTAQNKVYDRTTSAIVTYTNLGNLVSLETVIVTGTGLFDDFFAQDNKPVTALAPSIADGSGGGIATNYSLPTPTGLTANITRKELTVTGLVGNNKVYNATPAATVSGIPELNGVILGDGVSLRSNLASFNFANKNVGNSKPITATGYSLLGTDTGNYFLTQPTGLVGNITPASLTVIGITGNNKVYNRTTVATVSGSASLSVLFSGDAVTLGGSPTFVFDTENVGTTKPITASGYTISGTDSTNYVFSQPTGLAGNITPASLNITGITGNSKVYDSTLIASVTGSAALSGVIGGDTVTLAGTPAFAFSTKGVGNNKPITASGFTISGTNSTNYALSQPTGLTGDITPASLTVTGITGSNKVYDRTTDATVSGAASLSGLFFGDAVVLGGSPTFAFDTRDVGTSKLITASGYSVSGGDIGNYLFSQPTGLSANITAKALQVVADNKQKTVGQVDPALTFDVTGLISGDTSTGNLVREIGETAGTYGILVGTLDFGSNYDLDYTAGTFTIQAAVAPTISTAVLNAGVGFLNPAQRSQIVSLVVNFSSPVVVAANAFTLENVGLLTASSSFVPQSQLIVTPAGDARSVTITFASGSGVVTRSGGAAGTQTSNSLADGNYILRVDPSKVTASGTPMAGGSTPTTVAVDNFFRMFGDSNGDGQVGVPDLVALRNAGVTYNAALDWEGDGIVSATGTDRNNFNLNYGKRRRIL